MELILRRRTYADGLLAFLLLWPVAPPRAAGESPQAAQDPDKRFPPLKAPDGFKATLFACDPLIEYPSVIALGPRPGTLFVAHDYMTGLGTEIVRRDEIRLIEDTDGDGHADKTTVYAGGFNSIQGLAYHDGTVYVMHAPFLTRLRDTDGDGVADERRDLLVGLGWPPEKAPDRLHCANGVVVGHDGWLYLALGDRGCDVTRPEGDRLILNGGGILRCRPDGTDLHVFASGLRNIYDVALDEELNVFVRDNENDGGTYMIRVYHSFFGADHGYPYLYEERPDEAMRPLADLGLGSSAGGVCYLERAFPAEYRGDLFFCEWGRSVARYRREPAGATFAPMKEIEFAAGDARDPYGFKPTDLVVDRDGSLLVSDWADGQRPKRGRGRVYRITYVGEGAGGAAAPKQKPKDRGLDEWLKELDSESYHDRVEAQGAIERRGDEDVKAVRRAIQEGRLGFLGRLHAVWLIARAGGPEAIRALLGLAEKDRDPRVRAQAVRALADLGDPVLTAHRLEAGAGDAGLIGALSTLARGQEPSGLREIVIALGRLRWREAPVWLRVNLTELDPALAHAAQQTLRRSGNWPEILKLLDEPDAAPMRAIALRAIADRTDPVVVDGLIRRVGTDPDPRRRREYADALARVCRKPGPWVYWGFRPAPRPPNPEPWERTEAIDQALQQALEDADHAVGLFTLRRMQREKILARLEILQRGLQKVREPDTVAVVLESLRQWPAEKARAVAGEVAREKEHSVPNRLAALEIFVRSLDKASEGGLVELARSIEDSPVLAEALRQLGRRPHVDSRALLAAKLGSPIPEVRVASIEAAAELRIGEAGDPVLKLLADPDARVRRAAASGLGKLAAREAVEPLLKLTEDRDLDLRRRSLEALARLREPRAAAAALAGLQNGETQLAAMECLAEIGGPEHGERIADVAAKNRSLDILEAAVRALAKWERSEPAASPRRAALHRAVASIQGATGILLQWSALGPLPPEAASRTVERIIAPQSVTAESLSGAKSLLAAGLDSRVDLAPAKKPDGGSVWLAWTDFEAGEPARAQFLASASGDLQVWLNGRPAYRRAAAAAYAPDSDRFEADVSQGLNRLAVQASAPGSVQFHLRFRRKTSTAEHERLTQLALTSKGDPNRGRAIFLDPQKPGCVKCHRICDQGGRVGPDLTGAGRRFTKIHLIESILEPSRSIAPSYQNYGVKLKDGRVLVGVKVAETETTLTLGDAEGKDQLVSKAEIDLQKALPLSLMPEGLEKAVTEKEFVDLIAFLLSLR